MGVTLRDKKNSAFDSCEAFSDHRTLLAPLMLLCLRNFPLFFLIPLQPPSMEFA